MSKLFLSILLACAVSMAQESRATLTGTVTDPSGAAVPGATVIARHVATNAETKTTTNETGLYVLPFLNTGDYTVTATQTGFKTGIKQEVQLSISDRRQLDFQLEVGGTSEQVTVSARADLLDTASANRGTLIDAQKIGDLPLLGKNTRRWSRRRSCSSTEQRCRRRASPTPCSPSRASSRARRRYPCRTTRPTFTSTRTGR